LSKLLIIQIIKLLKIYIYPAFLTRPVEIRAHYTANANAILLLLLLLFNFILFLSSPTISFNFIPLRALKQDKQKEQELKIAYLDETFKPFTDRVHHRRKATFRPLFPFVSFQIPIQRMRHQPKRHAIQLSHVVQRLRQRARNAALGILEPVVARELVRHYRAQKRLNLLHHLVVQRLGRLQLRRDGLQVLHVELGQLAAIVQCSNLGVAH